MKKLLLSAFAFLAMAVNAQEVSLVFTKAADDWNIGYTSTNKCKGTETFSNGTYEVTFAGDGTNGFAAYDGYVLFGKKDAYMQLPAFDFDVEKIEFVGRSGASGSTKLNVFVGENAVSTETTGCTETNTYVIADDYQAAGNVYTIKVTSAHNAQVTEVRVYKKTTEPVVVADVESVYFWNYAYADPEYGTWYETNRQYITVTEKNFEENVALNAVMKSSGKTNGSYLENSTRFTVSGTIFTSGQINVMSTSKKPGVYEDAIQLKNGEDVYLEIPVKMVIVGLSDDGAEDEDGVVWPFSVADAFTLHSIMPNNGNYFTDPTHEWSIYDTGVRYYKGVVSSVKGYYNSSVITYYIADELGSEQTLQVYNGKGLNNADFTSAADLAVGDKVVVCGELADYNNAPELVNAYLQSYESVSTGINNVTTHVDNAIYNLQGQRISGFQKGINIVGGKKILGN